MSKYTITRKCGHEEVINIVGKVSERDRKAEWEEGRLCYDCWKAEQAAERAAESNAAAEEAKAEGLPRLEGSEKQIAWAETIRAKMLLDLSALETRHKIYQAKLDSGDFPPDTPEEKINAARDELAKNAVAIGRIKSNSAAKWFINNRNININQIIIDLRGN